MSFYSAVSLLLLVLFPACVPAVSRWTAREARGRRLVQVGRLRRRLTSLEELVEKGLKVGNDFKRRSHNAFYWTTEGIKERFINPKWIIENYGNDEQYKSNPKVVKAKKLFEEFKNKKNLGSDKNKNPHEGNPGRALRRKAAVQSKPKVTTKSCEVSKVTVLKTKRTEKEPACHTYPTTPSGKNEFDSLKNSYWNMKGKLKKFKFMSFTVSVKASDSEVWINGKVTDFGKIRTAGTIKAWKPYIEVKTGKKMKFIGKAIKTKLQPSGTYLHPTPRNKKGLNEVIRRMNEELSAAQELEEWE